MRENPIHFRSEWYAALVAKTIVHLILSCFKVGITSETPSIYSIIIAVVDMDQLQLCEIYRQNMGEGTCPMLCTDDD